MQLEGLCEVLARLVGRVRDHRQLPRAGSGQVCVPHVAVAGGSPVAGDLGRPPGPVGRVLDQTGEPGVEPLAPRGREAAVRRVADQCVSEPEPVSTEVLDQVDHLCRLEQVEDVQLRLVQGAGQQ